MKLYIYHLVRLRRIPKKHQVVGWHLQQHNLFVYFIKLRSSRQKEGKVSSKIKKQKENLFLFGVV